MNSNGSAESAAPCSADDSPAMAEVRRTSGQVRAALRDLAAEVEPAHYALHFERLAVRNGDDNAGE